MEVIETIVNFKNTHQQLDGTLGFVPTMGYLHEGHLALVRRAKAENDVVVASIFVNPTQFGPREDFQEYPRDMNRDLDLLRREGVSLVFTPSPQDIYPEGYDTYIEVGSVTQKLEGVYRPGHFKGVATVVAKLFNIVKPSRTYFGQKDAQQVVVIKKMAKDLDIDTEIIVVPTVREADGLAMSSRNSYLDPQERIAALVLWKAIYLAREMFGSGEKDAGKIKQSITSMINQEPLAKIDYISLAHPETLQELTSVDKGSLFSLAVLIGKTRLIDNILLD